MLYSTFILSFMRTVFLKEDAASKKCLAISMRIVFGFACFLFISNLDVNE